MLKTIKYKTNFCFNKYIRNKQLQEAWSLASTQHFDTGTGTQFQETARLKHLI